MEWLLEGPRGRRLLHELQRGADPLWALADSVAWARYWQEPDDVDLALAEDPPAVVAVDLPAWWSEPLAVDEQVLVTWEGDLPELTGAEARLQSWYDGTVLEEARAARRTGDWSGRWWSTPQGCPWTHREGPAWFVVEDDLGWTGADLTPVAPVREVRVYEVQSPADWVRLVSAYPMQVTASRGQDWHRATGATGPLLQPDFRAVSAEWDAVHVSVRGYLTTATRALPVDGATTVLAGWSPDETWWLTDCLAVTGPTVPRTFTRD